MDKLEKTIKGTECCAKKVTDCDRCPYKEIERCNEQLLIDCHNLIIKSRKE